MADSRPIGIFDSGIGGLTVYRELAARLPGERLLYLGDTARVPYGTKSVETVTRYSRECARFLLTKQVKILVVACNTASAVALPGLGVELPVPVLGVIEPGARRACRVSDSGKIGVIGTEATIQSGAYAAAIARLRPGAEVTSVACPLLVPLAEEGWADSEVARLVAQNYLESLRTRGVEALVLGCTHYPILKKVLQEVLGPDILLVDSAEATALEVVAMLTERGWLSDETENTNHFYVTDSSARFAKVGSRFLGTPMARLELVDITGET